MTCRNSTEPPVLYYRLIVARAHLGRRKTEFVTVYVRTDLEPVELMFNLGKPLAGIKRVDELTRVSEAAFVAAVVGGGHCFVAVRREAVLCPGLPRHCADKLRRARRYETNRRVARLNDPTE